MIRVGILGATGYTALEAIRLLLRHPDATVTAVTSRQDIGKPIDAVHPILTGSLHLPLSALDAAKLAEACDVIFCCLPHGASAETVHALREYDLRVVDFSADFRLRDVGTYEAWYHVQHPWPEQLGKVAYGLPELFAEEIAGAQLVANPGCYPTTAILPLAPLLSAGVIDGSDIIVDAKSGVSGAGRTPKLINLYGEANESIMAYGVGQHRHQPEMIDVLERFSGVTSTLLFTPHLTPMDRGILATIYVRPTGTDAAGIMRLWQQQYGDSPFVHVVDHLPATKHVSGTNHVHMAVRQVGDRVVLLCALDNLIKGASGAAVQNLNCMYGLNPTLGLEM